MTVDKGYVYDKKSCNLTYTSLRPEETKTGYVMFEILETTIPLEIRYYGGLFGKDPAFVLDIRGESIPLSTAATNEEPRTSLCSLTFGHDSIIECRLFSLMQVAPRSIATYDGVEF